jgi:penicillin amidase
MNSSTKMFTTQAIYEKIFIQRNSHGFPEFTTFNREDLCFGIGYAHAWDRLVQMILVRAIAQGRANEVTDGKCETADMRCETKIFST